MFSLIISIIAIALVAALALASIYYGGEAFNKGTTDADASTLINQGQQIQAAVTMSNIDRVDYANLVDLETEYLQEVPTFQGLAWGEPDPVTGYSVLAGAVNADVCTAMNVKVGLVDAGDGTGTAEIVAASTGVFGCINGASTPFYRVGTFY